LEKDNPSSAYRNTPSNCYSPGRTAGYHSRFCAFNFQFGGYLFGEPQRSYESILRDLAEIINDPNTLEDDLQNFLEKYPELIMENTYEKVIPQACIVPIGREDEKAWQADFILRPFNQIDFSKILEIKRPQIPIQKREASGHQRFSSKLFDAVQQLRDYESAFNKSEETRKRFKELYNFEVLYPELHLIIGRESQIIDPRAIRAFQHKTNIKIDSWDSFLDKLKKR